MCVVYVCVWCMCMPHKNESTKQHTTCQEDALALGLPRGVCSRSELETGFLH